MIELFIIVFIYFLLTSLFLLFHLCDSKTSDVKNKIFNWDFTEPAAPLTSLPLKLRMKSAETQSCRFQA